MSELSKALKAIKENPEDLSSIPQLIARAEELESQDFDYQERITKLQEYNRNLLSQIPLPGEEPPAQEPQDEEVTFEQAQSELFNVLENTRGNY